MNSPPVVLSIAGSDSSSCSGMQADLKTFAALGVFGLSTITAVTAQNTFTTKNWNSLPETLIEQQLQTVTEDISPLATKTGMLANANIVKLVARLSKKDQLGLLVVDPVLSSSSGKSLCHSCKDGYLENLFPLAEVITPNIVEASLLTDKKITSLQDMIQAGKDLSQTGCKTVIIKGGHFLANSGSSVDVIYSKDSYRLLFSPRISTNNTRGTGCTFSAAICAFLAKGLETFEAIKEAKLYLNTTLVGAKHWELGQGPGPLDHLRF